MLPAFSPAASDGVWTGTTDQGYAVSFEVENNQVKYFDIRVFFPSAQYGTDFHYPGAAVESDAFQIDYSWSSGWSETAAIAGTFSSETAATGTWSVTLDSDSASGTWQASRAYADDITGWWSVPNENGTGLSLEKQGDNVYMVWYVYDASGNPVWYSSWMSKDGEGYSGTLREFYDGWELGGTVGNPNQQSIGTVSLVFSDAGHGTITWDAAPRATQSKSIEKYLSGLRDLRGFEGWYVIDGMPSTGLFLEARDETLFVGWFHYGSGGSPRWWVLGGWMDEGGFSAGTTTYTQSFLELAGGQTLNGDFTPPTATTQKDSVTFTFGSEKNPAVTMQWNGTDYTLTPYDFSSGDPF